MHIHMDVWIYRNDTQMDGERIEGMRENGNDRYIGVNTYAFIHIYMYMYENVYVYIYVRTHVHIYK
jgi:hypothetical protein